MEFRDDGHVGTDLVGGDRRAQTSAAPADDQYVVVMHTDSLGWV
jgi:hypothetical protein